MRDQSLLDKEATRSVLYKTSLWISLNSHNRGQLLYKTRIEHRIHSWRHEDYGEIKMAAGLNFEEFFSCENALTWRKELRIQHTWSVYWTNKWPEKNCISRVYMPFLKGILKRILLHLFKTLPLCNGEKKWRVFKNLLRAFSLPFYQTASFTQPRQLVLWGIVSGQTELYDSC